MIIKHQSNKESNQIASLGRNPSWPKNKEEKKTRNLNKKKRMERKEDGG